jgi:hypothetical protein
MPPCSSSDPTYQIFWLYPDSIPLLGLLRLDWSQEQHPARRVHAQRLAHALPAVVVLLQHVPRLSRDGLVAVKQLCKGSFPVPPPGEHQHLH